MKFLHAADIHLDSPLTGLARNDDIPASVTENPTRRAFANLVDLAIAEDVAFVVIAGDLFDADWKDYSTGLFFARQMQRLAPRPCILIRGNHDARSVITRNLQPPPNVREFSSRAAHSITLADFGVMLHGRSFPDRAVPEDLAASYPAAAPGLLNIGVLHTSAEGSGRHDTYAPCTVASLQAKGYGYWALGHIHDRRTLSETPWIVFPGNIQGRHANERGDKGVSIVEVENGRIVRVEHRAIDVLRFAVPPDIDCEGAETIADIAGRVRGALAVEAAKAQGRPVIARVHLSGATPLHAAIAADPAMIEAECRNAAISVGAEVYIDSVRSRLRPPASGATDHEALLGAFRESLDDPALRARLLADFAALATIVPRTPGSPPPGLPRDDAGLHDLLPDAWQEVLHEIEKRAAS